MVGLVSSAMPQEAAQTPPAAQTAPSQGAANYTPPVGVEKPGSMLKNPALKQIEAGVEENLTPEQQQMYSSIVLAGMDLAFNAKTNPKLLEGLQSSPDIVKNISLICAGMMGIIYQQVQPDINQFLPAAVPASITMMCQIMEFTEQIGMAQYDQQQIAKCTADTTQAVLAKLGAGKDKLQEAGQAIQSGTAAQGA